MEINPKKVLDELRDKYLKEEFLNKVP